MKVVHLWWRQSRPLDEREKRKQTNAAPLPAAKMDQRPTPPSKHKQEGGPER